MANVAQGNATLENRVPLFRLWRKDRTWERINRLLREKVRLKLGKKRQPSAGILDSQSAKTSEGGSERGFDAGKKVTGRERHTLGHFGLEPQSRGDCW